MRSDNNSPFLGTVNTAEAELRYMRFGKGERQMVILPGLSVVHVTDSAAAVSAALSRLSDEFTVWLFDVKEDVPEGCSLMELSETSSQAIKSLGLSDVYQYGASMGGMQSVYIAAEHPELVRKLVLGASACRANAVSDSVFRGWIRLASSGDRAALAEDMIGRIYSPATNEKYGAVLKAQFAGISGEDLSRFIRTASALPGFDLTAQAEKIACPLLIIGSRGDRVLTCQASEELAGITGGEAFYYDENFGHAVYDEAPDFLDRMLEFFNE